MEPVNEMRVLGHYRCRDCGNYAPDGTGAARIEMCADCVRARSEQAATVTLAHDVAGRVVVDRPKPNRRRPVNPTRERNEARKAYNQARSRTYQRLVAIYRPMYELILAEEKAKLGIGTSPLVKAQYPAEVIAEIDATIADAAERAERAMTAARLQADASGTVSDDTPA